MKNFLDFPKSLFFIIFLLINPVIASTEYISKLPKRDSNYLKCPNGFVPDSQGFKTSKPYFENKIKQIIQNKKRGLLGKTKHFFRSGLMPSLATLNKNGNKKKLEIKIKDNQLERQLIIDYFVGNLYFSKFEKPITLNEGEIKKIFEEPFITDKNFLNKKENYKLYGLIYGPKETNGSLYTNYLFRKKNNFIYLSQDFGGQVVFTDAYTTEFPLSEYSRNYAYFCSETHLQHRNITLYLLPYKNDSPKLLVFVKDVYYRLQKEKPKFNNYKPNL